jgi:protein phosphatase
LSGCRSEITLEKPLHSGHVKPTAVYFDAYPEYRLYLFERRFERFEAGWRSFLTSGRGCRVSRSERSRKSVEARLSSEAIMSVPTKAIEIPDSGRAQRLRVVAGGCSVQGPRRETNEDARYMSPALDLFIVADGVGGHAAGEVASRFAVDVIGHELARFVGDAPDEEIERRVHAAIDRAHCLILDQAAATPEQHGAETTVVLGLLVNHRLYVTGIGDSRAYLIRGRKIERLTVDDTWPDVLRSLGKISADEAKRHHMRNILLRALGMQNFKAGKKEIRVLDVYHGDRYLLASDGLTDVVGEVQLQSILSRCGDPQRAAEELAQQAIANGGGDDVTCVVFHVESDLETHARSEPAGLWQRIRSLLTSS